MSKNDITGDSIRTKGVLSQQGRDTFDRIFSRRTICYWSSGTWCDKSDLVNYAYLTEPHRELKVSFELNNEQIQATVDSSCYQE